MNTKELTPQVQLSLEEVKMLREEVVSFMSERQQLIQLLYTGVAALLAFAVNSKNALMCLIPFCIILPTYLMVRNKNQGIQKIGAYIQVFYNGPDFHWEQFSYELNAKTRKKTSRYFVANSFIFPFFLLGLVSLVLFCFFMDWGSFPSMAAVYKLAMGLVCLASTIFMLVKQDDIDRLKAFYISAWENMKKEYEEREESAPMPDCGSGEEPNEAKKAR